MVIHQQGFSARDDQIDVLHALVLSGIL